MTNVSRSSVIFFLVALMMLQPLTSIDYDLEASQGPSFSSTGSESIQVSLNRTHLLTNESINALISASSLSSTSSYSIDWKICIGNSTTDYCSMARFVDPNGSSMLAQGNITIPSGLTTFMTNLPFMTNISNSWSYGSNHYQTNRTYSFLAVLKIVNVTLDFDRQSFNKVGNKGSQTLYGLNMDSYYLKNQQIEFDFSDMWIGYLIQGTSLRADLDLLDRDSNQMTHLSNYSHTSYHPNTYTSTQMFEVNSWRFNTTSINISVPGNYSACWSTTNQNLNPEFMVSQFCHDFEVMNATSTGLEDISVSLNRTHLLTNQSILANLSVNNLDPSNSHTYVIDWKICIGNSTTDYCSMARFVDPNGSSMLAQGNITIPSGLTTFMTNLPFMTNISNSWSYGSNHYQTNRTYSFLAVLKIVNVTLDFDRQSFNKVGNKGSQTLYGLNMDSYYLKNQQIEFDFSDMWIGYLIQGTSLRADLDLLDRDSNQMTHLSNYSHTSYHPNTYTSTQMFEVNSWRFNTTSINISVPGNYSACWSTTNQNLNPEFMVSQFCHDFEVMNATSTGLEDISVSLNRTHLLTNQSILANLSVNNLDPSNSHTYVIDWKICIGNSTTDYCSMARFVDPNGSSMLAQGNITIPSGLTTFMTNLPFMTNISNSWSYGSNHYQTNRTYSFLAVLKIVNVTLDFDRQSFNKVGNKGSQTLYGLNMDSYYLKNQQIEFDFSDMWIGYLIQGTSLRADLDLLDRDSNQMTHLSNYSHTSYHPNTYTSTQMFEVNSWRFNTTSINISVPGNYSACWSTTNQNLNPEFMVSQFCHDFEVMDDGITDNSTMSIAAGDGYANFSFAQQDLNEWYTVYWNLTNASNAVVDSGNFGYISNAANYFRNVTTISGLPMGAYCLEASLYVGNQGNYLQNSTEDCYSLVLDDADGDGVGDGADQCPNTPAGESVNAVGCSNSQLDDDSDGVTNDVDQCPNTPVGESVNAVGCLDSQLDDDNDGVNNDADQCPNTPVGESVDAVGCSESQLDDDGDGITNDIDLCPNTYAGDPVDADGCSQYQLDDDGDGVNNAVDQCLGTPPGVPVMAQGCPNSDYDADQDGVVDSDDLCGETPAGSTVDANGCTPDQLIDTDGDGVKDQFDQCPDTVAGETVDAQGCSDDQQDDDNDGIPNGEDNCANTDAGANPDANGCSEEQRDDDGDGYNNGVDDCPQSPSGASVDTNGCAESELDDDNDLITNDIDDCANTPAGETVDAVGCSQSQIDDDGDGVSNANDQCPNTPAGTVVDAKGCPTPDTLPKPTSPKCDIYYSLESQGVKLNGDAAIPSVSGFGGVIAIPPGSYYVIASCSDPDGDIVNATILTPIAEQSGAGKQFTVGALIQVPEGMNETMPIMIAWNDGKEFYQASFIIKLGEIPEDIDTSNGEGISGFTAMTMMTSFLIAGWIQGRRRLENQS